MSENGPNAAQNLYPMFLRSPSTIPEALQRHILKWAEGLSTGDDYLVMMARRSDLAPDVEAALSEMSAKVLAAWLTVPGRVGRHTARFLKENRISVLSVVAATEGLPEELYEHCANRDNATVASHLVLNRDASETQRATAVTTLVRYLESGKPSYTASRKLDARLAAAFQHTPALAEVAAEAATKAETVAMVLKVPGIRVTDTIVSEFVEMALSQMAAAYAAIEKTGGKWTRYRKMAHAQSVIGTVVNSQVLPVEALKVLKSALASTRTKLLSHDAPEVVGHTVNELDGLIRRIDRFMKKPPIGEFLYQIAGTKDQDVWRRLLLELDRITATDSRWLAPPRMAMAEAALVSPAVTASGIAWAIRAGLFNSANVSVRMLRHIPQRQFYRGNREGGMATYAVVMPPGAKPSDEMEAMWEHFGVSMTEVVDVATRLHLEVGDASTAVAWAQHGDSLDAALVAEVDVADLRSIADREPAREALLAYVVEKIDDGDDAAWERFAMLAEHPFHGNVGDLIARTCRLAQLEST